MNARAENDMRFSTRGMLAFLAGFSAWTFDAFDFFILVYVLPDVAQEFHRPVVDIATTLTASLVMRPVGALIFGLIADRWGRRIPLMVDIVFYSVMEILSGLAPSYRVFLLLRLLYGVGMGGAWGVGASLALESVPSKWRGVLSGALQEGYALGNLLAAFAFRAVLPYWGWRKIFFIGAVPALLTLLVLLAVEETDAWKSAAEERKGWRDYFRLLGRNWRRFAYLVLLMAMMNCMSHGTQDLYPTFLRVARRFEPGATFWVSVISMVGAILGGIVVGHFSDYWGRRRAMVTSTLLGLLMIPLWVGASAPVWVGVGAFLIQFMVQGTWGVIPAHINELAPRGTRGFLPGFAYQVGVLIAADTPRFQAAMANRFGYAATMSAFAATIFILGAIVIGAGPEAHGERF